MEAAPDSESVIALTNMAAITADFSLLEVRGPLLPRTPSRGFCTFLF